MTDAINSERVEKINKLAKTLTESGIAPSADEAVKMAERMTDEGNDSIKEMDEKSKLTPNETKDLKDKIEKEEEIKENLEGVEDDIEEEMDKANKEKNEDELERIEDDIQDLKEDIKEVK